MTDHRMHRAATLQVIKIVALMKMFRTRVFETTFKIRLFYK
jgi:hypothetical protein